MAQKESLRRGRPRRYDPDVAIARATQVFRDKGFAATTLDELGEAMGMNRPSIHAAFGDKAALFMVALGRYEAESEAALRAGLDPSRPLRAALREVFTMMMERFAAVDGGSGGCLLFSAAIAETHSPPVRDAVLAATCGLDAAFGARFAAARDSGEIAASSDPQRLAILASGLVHSLSIRARAGESRMKLAEVIEINLHVICGPDDA